MAIRFYDAGLSTEALEFPIYHASGQWVVQLDQLVKIYTDNFKVTYANSPLEVDCDIRGLKNVYFEAHGKLSPVLLNSYMIHRHYASIAYAALPFQTQCCGVVGQFGALGARC